MNDFAELLRRLGYDLTALANALRSLFDQPRFRTVTVVIAAGATSGSASHGLADASGKSVPHRGAFIVGSDGPLTYPWIPPSTVSGSSTVTLNVTSGPVATTTVSLLVY